MEEKFRNNYKCNDGKIISKCDNKRRPDEQSTLYSTISKIVGEKLDECKSELTKVIYEEVMKTLAESSKVTVPVIDKKKECECKKHCSNAVCNMNDSDMRKVVGFTLVDGRSLFTVICKSGSMYLVNDQGEKIVEKPISGYDYSSKSDFLLVRRNDGKYAFIDKNGKVATEWLDKAYQFSEGKAKVVKGGDEYVLTCADSDSGRLCYKRVRDDNGKNETCHKKNVLDNDNVTEVEVKPPFYIDFSDFLYNLEDILWP